MPGEIIFTDTGPRLPSDMSLSDQILAISKHARLVIENDPGAYAADLEFLGTQSEEEIAGTAQFLEAQAAYADLCRTTPYPERGPLNIEILKAQDTYLSIGQAFLSLSHRAAKEIMPTDSISKQGGVISEQLTKQNREPTTCMLGWNVATITILEQSAQILATLTMKLSSTYLDIDEGQHIADVAMAQTQQFLRSRDSPPGLGDLVELIHDPTSTAGQRIPSELSAYVIKLYEKWLSTNRSCKGASEKAVTIISLQNTLENQAAQNTKTAEKLPSEAEIYELQEETKALIDRHVEKSAPFRPSWNSLKSGLKPFANELLRQSRQEKHPLPIPEDANKRITGILHVLEQLGNTADPAQSFQKITSIFIEECTIAYKKNANVDKLAAVNIKPDLSKWQSVLSDVMLISEHWDQIKPIIEKFWTPRQGTPGDAIIAIERSIAQFHASREIAKHELLKIRIKEAADNPSGTEHSRQRAAVLSHFSELGASQQQTAHSNTDLGRIFWMDARNDNERCYFCVTFNDTSNKEWAIFETITSQHETYAIPLDIIHEYGTLAEFVEVFDKEMQREFENYQVTHEPDWTTESHIARIMAKVAEPQ